MTFHPPLFDLFPGMRVALVVVRGIDNEPDRQEIDDRLRRAWDGAVAEVARYGNAQSHPRVGPWRRRLRAAGAHHHDFPSSIEALMRRAAKGGAPPHVNALVDIYNAISLELVLPVGGFDIGALHDADIDVRLTRDGDTFDALDGAGPVPVPTGEVCYATGTTVLTRHLVWRQSRPGLITSETTDAVLISEVLGDLDAPAGAADRVFARDDVLDDVTRAFRSALETWFEPRSLTAGICDEASPVLEA
jgi:DNA/RNA-binding domain of Phe-tRNA-synthetase-like protein